MRMHIATGVILFFAIVLAVVGLVQLTHRADFYHEFGFYPGSIQAGGLCQALVQKRLEELKYDQWATDIDLQNFSAHFPSSSGTMSLEEQTLENRRNNAMHRRGRAKALADAFPCPTDDLPNPDLPGGAQ